MGRKRQKEFGRRAISPLAHKKWQHRQFANAAINPLF